MMCGIAGIYNLNSEKNLDSSFAIKMRDGLGHRGPDDRGIYASPDKRAFLANTRLSIIDLTAAGHQPMSDSQQQVWISYNGEIYNYSELRRELKEKGYNFRSNSDTEVIINGYKEWGIESLLTRLRGMFAFAIYDSRSKEPAFIIARDRFGIKPLYYYHEDGVLLFASEVKAIIRSGAIPVDYNKESIIAFLLFGYIPAPLTDIKGVFSLPVGSYLCVRDGRSILKRYYDLLDIFVRPKTKAGADLYNHIRHMLDEALALHLISDAPLGIFLSGGIDSSSLVALASRHRNSPLVTLSIVFEEQGYSELPYQRLVAKKYRTDHREIKVTEEDFYAELDNIFEAMDQPTNNGINTYFVSRAAKQAGLKTVLSGLGGDEVFCGYDSFKRIGFLRSINSLPKPYRSPFVLAGSVNERWKKLTYLKDDNYLNPYLIFRGFFVPADVSRVLGVSEKEVSAVLYNFGISILESRISVLDSIDWLSYTEIMFYLQNQLLKDTDIMSMHHSVETRVPFLDNVLVDHVVSLDSALKLGRGNMPKPLLVKSLKDMLPQQVIFRKKQGFTFPFNLWIKRKGRELLEKSTKGRMEASYIEGLWHKFTRGTLHWSRIWALIVMGRY